MENEKAGFVDRLKQEIVTWKYEGWISKRGGSKILAHYGIDARFEVERNPVYSRNWLIIIGIALVGIGILLGAGGESSQFSRTLMTIGIFIGLVIAYALGFYFTFKKSSQPLIGELITAAAVLFYGYALWSFNSIYNIYANHSTVFLLWAIGIVPLAFILRSHYILIFSVVGFTAWTATYSAHYSTPNFIFLPIAFIILFPMVYREKSIVGLLFGVAGLSLWLGMALNAYSTSAQIFLPIVFVLWSILLYHLAYLHRKIEPFNKFYFPLKVFSMLLLFVGLSFLALRSLGLTQARFLADAKNWFFEDGLPVLICSIVIAAAIIIIGIINLVRKPKELSISMTELWMLDIAGIAMIIYMLFPEAIPEELKKSLLTDYFLTYTMVFNLVLFLFIAGLIWIGIQTKTAWILNLGIVFAVITSLARYFDTFLPMLPKSTFLFIGGLALLLLGVCIKRN